MNASVGIDIGGTFTDIIVCPEADRPATILKTPSTPHDPGEGLLTGLTRALQTAGVSPGQITRLVHGTTVGTNAVLQHDGARIGIITTAGFEDILFIGRAKRPEMYDLFAGPATPGYLCPRDRIHGVSGRIGPAGQVVDPLDEAAVMAAADRLVTVDKVEAIAVCLLFSFIDPVQERRVAELIAERYPDVQVSLSARIDPRFREFERLVLTAMDAYIRPRVGAYVRRLRARLDELGVCVPLQVMESHGGIVASELIEERAVGTLLSGLAGGASGAAAIAQATGRPDVIGFDMGGTSTDVTLVADGRPLLHDAGEINGQPLRLPTVDVHTIGAGGGSIAYVDAAGTLRVGPHSAGADPGPAAYGLGGTEPTVTDANLLLGFLGEEGLAGGSLRLNAELARKALTGRVADRLGMTPTQAAWGVHRIASAAMSAAVRVISVARGNDPRRFALVAFGGAGPLHACTVADDLGMEQVLIPPHPGVLSAYGLLAADISVPRWRTFHAALDTVDHHGLHTVLAAIAEQAAAETVRAGADRSDLVVERAIDARYVGQSHELTVPVPEDTPAERLPEIIADAFGTLHRTLYGQYDPEGRVEITAIRATATAPRQAPRTAGSGGSAVTSERSIYVPERDAFETVPVLTRESLTGPVAGPAVIVQEDSTTLLRVGWTARPHSSRTLVLTRDGGSRP